jgi:16S rRNA (adenine1518-N6/adenine1519-N6)-dimethyltransferase
MDEIRYDQHFMIDEKTIEKIIDLLDISENDVVLEIGPGKGALTKHIAKKAKKTTCVEIDENNSKFLNFENCNLIIGNAVDYIDDISCNKIVSNLPYSISEPFFKKLSKKDFDVCILTVGKRFYKIITDKKNKLFYFANSFFDIEFVTDLNKDIFEPKPKVNSCILRIYKKKEKSDSEKILSSFFLQNDKLLKNALMNALWNELKITKKQAKKKVLELGIKQDDLDKNMDLISNEKFLEIVEKIKKII